MKLQELLLDAGRIEAFLAEVATLATEAVDRARSCGVAVVASAPRRLWAGASDEFAQRMHEVQLDVDDGPCLQCLRTGVPVRAAAIASDPRWPTFTALGRDEGAGSALVVPVILGGETIGALNLYSDEPDAFDNTDHSQARQFADHAAGTVALAIRLTEREDRERNLQVALASRATIDQAIGVLVGQRGISAQAAFDVLRHQSQRTNTKLRDVATTVIAAISGHPTTARSGAEDSIRY
ncbi:GAF and ANTAR domain-containing protein [Pseudonocardia sp. GCM10023141]|uniref:GAF and ANTAR domain-containing protein n=1 Tax=Pseudonocardia sp. GCM10023141 TaxID=3252653 RepID=UPI00360A6B4A